MAVANKPRALERVTSDPVSRRKHRSECLQRRRAADQGCRSAGSGRFDRPGRGAPRGGDPAAERDESSPVAFDPAQPKAKVLKAVEPFIQ